MTIDLVANSPFDYAISVLCLGVCAGMMVMVLRIVWRDLSSSLDTVTKIETLLGRYDRRLKRIDAILDRIEGEQERSTVSK